VPVPDDDDTGGVSTNGSPARRQRALDPDVLPWERQAGEPDAAYAGFLTYRDMERRSTRDVGPSAGHWSSDWLWPIRVLEWDRYVQRQDAEALVRYRITMNERQRAASRLAQQKIVTWLVNLDPSRLSPHEAARWFEVAARLEREAAGVGLAAEISPPPAVPDPFEGLTLGDILGMTGQGDEIDAAERLFAEMSGEDFRPFQPSNDDAGDPDAGLR